MEEEKGKSGVVKALKLVYRAYDKNSFLYGSDTADYTILMNKVSEKQAKEMEKAGELSRQLFLRHPAMKFKIDPNLAISVIYSLIMNIKKMCIRDRCLPGHGAQQEIHPHGKDKNQHDKAVLIYLQVV